MIIAQHILNTQLMTVKKKKLHKFILEFTHTKILICIRAREREASPFDHYVFFIENDRWQFQSSYDETYQFFSLEESAFEVKLTIQSHTRLKVLTNPSQSFILAL